MPTLFVLTREPRIARQPPLTEFVLGFGRWEKAQTSLPGGVTPHHYRALSGAGTMVLPEENWTDRQMRLLRDLWGDMVLVSEDLNTERYATVLSTLEGRSTDKTRPLVAD